MGDGGQSEIAGCAGPWSLGTVSWPLAAEAAGGISSFTGEEMTYALAGRTRASGGG